MLVVDDEPANLGVLFVQLEQAHFRVEQDTVHINVHIELKGATIILIVKNDGPNYPPEVLQMEQPL